MNYLLFRNRFLVLVTILLVFLALNSLLAQVTSYLYPEPVIRTTGPYLVLKFGFVVLFAPLVETLICQQWLISLVRRKLRFKSSRKRWICAILISSIIFGLGHSYNLMYMAETTILGLILGATYWLFTVRKDLSPVLAVYILHLINNLLTFTCNDFMGWL